MIADAVTAEAFKLRRNGRTLFWGFLFTPALALVVGVASQFLMRAELPPEIQMTPVDIGRATVSAFAEAGGPLTVLFALVAAAVLFAGEYRWETWRLLAPRGTRTQLLSAKIAVFAAGSALTILLIGLAGVISALVGGAIDGRGLDFDMEVGAFLQGLVGHALVSWLQLLQVGGVAALAAVLTRSMLGGVMVPLGLSIALAVLQFRLVITEPVDPEWWKLWLVPANAFEYARVWLSGTQPLPGQDLSPVVGVLALAGLLLWLLLGYGGALVAFTRQDLAKE